MHVGEIGYQFCQELKTPVGSVALAAVTKYGCAPQRGLGGEIAEFVDESDFACEAGFQQDVLAFTDHPHPFEALDRVRDIR